MPWEQTLGFAQRLTPAASEVVSMLGVQSTFAEVAERTLLKACGLRLSESTVERVTEYAGERLRKLLAEGVTFSLPETWDWHFDAQGRTCATSASTPPACVNKAPAAAAAEPHGLRGDDLQPSRHLADHRAAEAVEPHRCDI